jgi:hypothetical protein
MLYLPSAGKLFIPVHRTGYSSFEDFIKLISPFIRSCLYRKESGNRTGAGGIEKLAREGDRTRGYQNLDRHG